VRRRRRIRRMHLSMSALLFLPPLEEAASEREVHGDRKAKSYSICG
jgi:hypothetical protein